MASGTTAESHIRTSFTNYPPEVTKPFTLSKERCDKWIEAHSGAWKYHARRVIGAIEEISYATFKDTLKESVAAYEHFLSTLPERDRSFVIVIPDHEQDPLTRGEPPELKSNLWVSRLAMQFFTKKPDAVEVVGVLDAKTLLEKHTDRRHLIFDDAAYTGTQLRDTLEYVPGADLIVPFMTTTAQTRLKEKAEFIAPHKHLQTIEELGLSDIPVAYPLDFHSVSHKRRTLTLFHHKLADLLSCEREIFEGRTLLGKLVEPLFIEGVVPYKSKEAEVPLPEDMVPPFAKESATTPL